MEAPAGEVFKGERLAQVMREILAVPGNNCCADCCEQEPRWASASLGVFVCIGCSGVHRSLGVHVSRIKSIQLDHWSPDELQFVRDRGNKKAAEVWERRLPPFFVRPGPADSILLKEQFIRAKYELKLYTADGNSADASDDAAPLPHRTGFLTKQGAVVKNWKRRWFELSGSLLSYYVNEKKEGEPKGVISLTDVTLIDAVPPAVNGRAFCFQIVTEPRTWMIQASSGQDMYGWVQSLRSAQKFLCMCLPGGKKASQIDMRTVSSQMARAEGGVAIQKRRVNRRTIPYCFQGSAAVDWMIGVLRVESRQESVRLGKQLLEEGFLRNAEGSENEEGDFVDDPSHYYQLLKTSSAFA